MVDAIACYRLITQKLSIGSSITIPLNNGFRFYLRISGIAMTHFPVMFLPLDFFTITKTLTPLCNLWSCLMLLQVTFIETHLHCEMKCITINSNGMQHDQSSLLLLLQKKNAGPRIFLSDNRKRGRETSIEVSRPRICYTFIVTGENHGAPQCVCFELSTTTIIYDCHQCDYTIQKTVTLFCQYRCKYRSFISIWILWNT